MATSRRGVSSVGVVQVADGGVPVEGEHDDAMVGVDASWGPGGHPTRGLCVVLWHHEVVQPRGALGADQVCMWPHRGLGRPGLEAGGGNPEASAAVAEHVLGFQVTFRGAAHSVAGSVEDHVEVAA